MHDAPFRNISELDQLSALDDIAHEYARTHGIEPFNLSHWDPFDDTVRKLLKHLVLPPPGAFMPYIYSYDLNEQKSVMKRLGLETNDRYCLATPTGTSAITFSVWWLKRLGISRLLVLCPSYFPVFHACRMFGIQSDEIHMIRSAGHWAAPSHELRRLTENVPDGTAVWITNPVYCTGVYLKEEAAKTVMTMLDKGIPVVVDECLALNGLEFNRWLPNYSSLLGLYSPHKAVSVNAVKFGAIVCHVQHAKFFEDWTDVLVGGLGLSNYSAIQHFLSDSFDSFQAAFLRVVSEARQAVQNIVATTDGALTLDQDTSGYFVTCYVPSLPSATCDDAFLRRLVEATGAIVIPGSRNHFDPKLGFNFRLNLARTSPQFLASLHRLAAHLSRVTIATAKI